MRKPVLGFPTRSRTNQAVQPQKMARGLKFQIQEVEGLYYVAKIKALISGAITAQLICFFVFQICKKQDFSHEAAQMIMAKYQYTNGSVGVTFSSKLLSRLKGGILHSNCV